MNLKLVLGTVAVILAVGGGVAYAATKVLTPRQESQAVIDDAASQLGVSPDKLSGALKQALKNRVDAAVNDGRLTKKQGDRLKERIDDGPLPLVPPFGFGDHDARGIFHARLETAAEYLDMTVDELRNALDGRSTLAQVAKDRGKSVDGLIDAMVAGAEQELDKAVEAGRMTEADKKEMLVGIRKRIADLVNGRFPSPLGPRFAPPFGHRIFRADERPPLF